MARILTDQVLSDKTFAILEKQHPCANDTTILVKSDTVTIEEEKLDTLFFNTLDSIMIPKTIIKTVLKTVKIHDTAKIYVINNRSLKLAEKQIIEKQILLNQSEILVAKYKKQSNNRLWLAIISIITGGVFIFFLAKFKMK